jgi:hypothetical protein
MGDGDLSKESGGDCIQDAEMPKRLDITVVLQCGFCSINAV